MAKSAPNFLRTHGSDLFHLIKAGRIPFQEKIKNLGKKSQGIGNIRLWIFFPRFFIAFLKA